MIGKIYTNVVCDQCGCMEQVLVEEDKINRVGVYKAIISAISRIGWILYVLIRDDNTETFLFCSEKCKREAGF